MISYGFYAEMEYKDILEKLKDVLIDTNGDYFLLKHKDIYFTIFKKEMSWENLKKLKLEQECWFLGVTQKSVNIFEKFPFIDTIDKVGSKYNISISDGNTFGLELFNGYLIDEIAILFNDKAQWLSVYKDCNC
jgi:hypothetical protein